MSDNDLKKYPMLDDEVASAIISNVFTACNQTPSSVPLNVLSSYTEYRRDRFSLQKGILIFILVIFLLLPLCFISPRFQVQEIGISETGIPTYEVRVSNIIPVRLVSARLGDRPIAVYESRAKVFTVEPGGNGLLTITVTLVNRQYDLWTTEVTTVDASAPTLLNSQTIGQNLRIFVEDSGVGVDYRNAYAITDNGSRISPAGFNEKENYIDFAFQTGLNIFIPDKNGNMLQLVLTLK